MSASPANSPLWLLLAVLAVYRVAHLIAMETGPWALAERLRSAVVNRYPPTKQGNLFYDSWQAEGINCPLCLSFWLALPALLALWSDHWLALGVVAWFGLAGAVLVLHKVVQR